ncbi:MAG: hypothetical protein ACLVKO_11240 [Dysgonomonas sp.]
MKKKLSPIEELRAESERLKTEGSEQERRLKENVSYVSNNFGSLLISSVISSSVNSTKSLLGFSSSTSDNKLSGAFEKIGFLLPVIWKIAQPMLIGILTKKLSSFFFKKKKKKS